MHNCQNANYIVNHFFIFIYCILDCIMYSKIYWYYINFLKKYKYLYLNVIFIIKLEYVQLIITLMITYAIMFERTNKTWKYIYNIDIQIIKCKCVNI